MATYNIGDDSGGYYNYRGTNVNPNTVGSSVNTGNWLVSGFCIQAASNSAVSGSNIVGQIWNSNGTVIWRSASLNMSGSDNSPPFAERWFYPNIYLAAGTYYFGFSKGNSYAVNWDCINGNNTSRCGNTVEGDLTYGGTGTIYRRLCGKITYTDVSVPTMGTTYATAGIGYIDVSWSVSNNGGIGIDTYHVYKNGVHTWTYDQNTTSLRDSVGNGVGASYKVYAHNSVGWSGESNTASATTANVPTMSSCTAVANIGSISVSWSASSNGGSGIDYYHLYRNGTYLGQYTGTSIVDNVGNGFTAYYTAYAHNAVGWSGGATSSTVTTPTPASSPASLSLSKGVTTMTATWTQPSNTGGTPVTGYRLEKSLNGSSWTAVTSTNSSTFTFLDTGLTPSTLYYYRIIALNAAGESLPTNASETTIGGYLKIYNSGTSSYDYVLPKYYNSSASAWTEGSAYTYSSASSAWIPGEVPPE